MPGPIQNQIGAVFVPVSDLARSVQWYSKLFGLPVKTTSHDGTIYDLQMVGDVALILDANKPVVSHSPQPLCFFWTEDIRSARSFLQASSIPILSAIEDIGSVSFVTFADPDGNLLMVCQRNTRDE
ncbi:MAG TPA: VOC family protein [Caldilineaceae bacterium]|nr:VOC family protein [Caldilineaceae bacterium]